jgi:hypothetical protein
MQLIESYLFSITLVDAKDFTNGSVQRWHLMHSSNLISSYQKGRGGQVSSVTFVLGGFTSTG